MPPPFSSWGDRATHLRGRAFDLRGDGLDIDLATFRLQIGYQNPLSNFKAALKQIVAIDSIPDYHLEFVEETVGEGEAADAAPRRGRRAPRRRVVIVPRPPTIGDGHARPSRTLSEPVTVSDSGEAA